MLEANTDLLERGANSVAVFASEAKQSSTILQLLDCRVAALLAMTRSAPPKA
ncbi:MAG: hypothetical protein JWL62_1299 [Hyphomicrobiales bacterium]|nr:hypothetical protein [Hyphomicrobiales bacterium]